MYLYITKDLDTKEYRINTLNNPEKMCLEAWQAGTSRQLLLGKTKDYNEADLQLSARDVINLIRKKTGNIFEYEELFNTDLLDYGNLDSKRLRFVNDIRKDSEKVKTEVLTVGNYRILCFKCEECKEDQVHIIGVDPYNYKTNKKYTLDHSLDSYLNYLILKMDNEVQLGYITIN